MHDQRKTFTMRVLVPKGSTAGEFKSQVETHYGIPWKIAFRFKEIGPNIWISCEEDAECKDPDDWTVTAKVCAKILLGGDKISFPWREPHDFSAESYFDPFYLNNSEENRLKARLQESDIHVKVEVDILKIFGVDSLLEPNFATDQVGWTDVVLKVEDRLFHVNKKALARCSPVFEAMLFGGFKEAKTGQVDIKQIDAEVFEAFLHVCHGNTKHVDDQNVADLMELADLYDAVVVREACEQKLMVADLPMTALLKVSEQFGFKNLMAVLLGKISLLSQMQPLIDLFEEFGPTVREALFNKILELNQEKESSEVWIKSVSGPSYRLDVQPFETVGEITRKVATVEGNPPERQLLSLNGRILEKKLRLFEISCQGYWELQSILPRN